MKTKNAVLFDLDGTLLDTAPDLINALNLLLANHGKPAMAVADVQHMLTQGSRAFISAFFRDRSDAERSQIRQEFFDLYSQTSFKDTRLFPGMLELLEIITRQQIPWGIVTNKLTRHTEQNLAALTLPSKPMAVVCGDTLPVAKPDPWPLLHACKLLQVKTHEVVYVGDSDVDAETGLRAGIDTVIVAHGYNTGKSQFDSLAIAEWIENPAQVLRWINLL